MSSKKRKVNSKSSKSEATLPEHRSGDSELGFSNGLGAVGACNEAERSPGTSYSGGDNGSASISSAFSPKLVDSASASPLSVNSLSNQSNRILNRIGETDMGLPAKSGRSDLHQPYAEHYGSPPPQKYPNSSVPPASTHHGSDYFHAQLQQRIGHNFPPNFHPSHLSPPSAFPTAHPYVPHHYAQHQPAFHQPMNQQPLRPRPQAQHSLSSSYASSTPMLTQLLQYPTTKEKPLETGGDYINSVKQYFNKKLNSWASGPPELANQNHLLGRTAGINHGARQDVQLPPGHSFNNQFFQQLDNAQQAANHTSARPFNNHPTSSKSPDPNTSNIQQDGDELVKSSQHSSHKKKSGAKKSVKGRSRMKRRSDVTKQETSSVDEKRDDDDADDGSDSSSTEVYSQITPSSTPPSSPQPPQTPLDPKHSSFDDLPEGHEKSHNFPQNSPYGCPDPSRFPHQSPNNCGGIASRSPGPMMRQPTPYPNQPPFLVPPGQASVRQNPHMSNFYSPYQTSNMPPSKPTESESYGGVNPAMGFKSGIPYHHQQGTHGGIVNSNFNAFPRPGMNGPPMPYPGASDNSQQHQPSQMPSTVTPYHRPPSNFQGKSEPPYGNRPDFFQSLPNHPGFPGGYPYDMPGYRPELGYRHPGDIYRPEGHYQTFSGYRPDAPPYGGPRMHPQEGRIYRHSEQNQLNQRHLEGVASSSGEFKPNDVMPGNHNTFSKNFPIEKPPLQQQGCSSDPPLGSQKHGEEGLPVSDAPTRTSLDGSSHPSVGSGKTSFAPTRMNNQWVMNMQGMMSGGSVVETPPQNDHSQPVVSMSSVKQMIGETFDAPNKDLSSHHGIVPDNFNKNQTPASQEASDGGKGHFHQPQHPQHPSRPNQTINSDFYHTHYRESPDGRLSAQDNNSHHVGSDTDSKSRGSRPSSTSGRSECKHKSSERVPSRSEFLKQDVYSPSLTPSNHVSMSPASQHDFDTYSPAPNSHQKFSSNPAFLKICEMGQEPDRVGFLERLFSFMNHRGSPVTSVPMICKQTIDLYCLYFLVRERGGMIEVTKNKKWRDVSSALSLGSSSSAGFTLKRNYGKYIYPFECKFDRGDIDPAPFLATLEISGSKKEAGKKSASDRNQAASDIDNNSASNSYHDDKDSTYFGRGAASPGSYGGEYGDDSLSQHPPHYGGRPLQSPEYSNRSFHNTERFDMISPHHEAPVEGPHTRYPPPPSYRPYKHPTEPYPVHFDQRRMPESTGEPHNYPPRHGGFWSSTHPSPHPYHQPPHYQFYGSSPGHYAQGLYPPRFPPRAEMERMQRLTSVAYPPGVRMLSFPLGSIESVRAKTIKRRKLNHRDLGPIDPWRSLMSLKSGLLCESIWALDALIILTRDEHTHSNICLSNMPGMLEVLVEHFKNSLISIFPKTKEQFEDLEISSEVQNTYQKQHKEAKKDDDEEEGDLAVGNRPFVLKASEITELTSLMTQMCRKRQQPGIKFSNKVPCKEMFEQLASKEWDCHNQLESSSFDWQMGRSDTSMHVLTAMTDVADAAVDREAETFKTKFFGSERLSLISALHGSTNNSRIDGNATIDLKQERIPDVSYCQTGVEMQAGVLGRPDECNASGGVVANGCSSTDATKIERPSERPDVVASELQDDVKPVADPICENRLKSSSDSAICGDGVTLYDRNKSLVEEIKGIQMFGIDDASSSTFSCSQIEAVATSCIGDRALVATEALRDEDFQRIKRKRERSVVAWEDEVLHPDESPLCPAGESRRELTSRCLSVSTILRNLSFIPSNDIEMSKHYGLILVLGKLLRLKHHHDLRELSARSPAADPNKDAEFKKEDAIPALEKCTDVVLLSSDDTRNQQVPNLQLPGDFNSCREENVESSLKGDEECGEAYEAWWWGTVDTLRENALVVFANVSGQLDLSVFPEEICIPVLDGLLHWMVCQVGNQDDEEIASYYSNHHFYATQHSSSLSFRRLVLETLCKLCILDSNVDLLLAVPPFSRILLLFTRLVSLFEDKQPLVVREMAVGLLSRLVPADPVVARALALQRSFIPSILDFLEASVDGRLSAADSPPHLNQHFSFHPSVGANTSVDVLCRVASILRHMSEIPENVPFISRHQQRLLHLLTSPALNRTVASVLSSVLALCS